MTNSNISKQEDSLVEGQSSILSEEVTIFLLDISGSMHGWLDTSDIRMSPDRKTKIEALKNAAKEFVQQRILAVRNGAKDHIGIITFGGHHDDARILFDPLGSNYEGLLDKIGNIRSGGSTPMAEAVDLALNIVSRFTLGFIRIIIVSDGQPNYADSVKANVSRAFNELGIVFDTMGVGNPNSKYDLDEEFLKEVAAIGGGEYTLITSSESFSKKFLEVEQERALLIGKGIFMLPEASNDEDVTK